MSRRDSRRLAGLAAEDDSASGQQPRETILLVEDEPAVRQLFALALVRAGYRVHETRNGLEALDVFDRHGESIDLLLTDIRMPLMGGAELTRQLRAKRPALKLLCISGYAGDQYDPAADFLVKPFSRTELLAKLREILDREDQIVHDVTPPVDE